MADVPKYNHSHVAKAKIETDFTLAVLVLFLLFWGQGGWYRLDCALGTQKACEAIAAEYVKKERP